MASAWYPFITRAIVLVFGLTVPPVSVRGDDSVTVQVSVDASESFGNKLSYHWRATDGHIVDQNSATTNWTLQNGPGMHFAYVLVSNGKGGYTEGRIAVNTDGNPTTTVVPHDQYPMAQPVSVPPTVVSGSVAGTLVLEDQSVCATRNPFFGVNVTASVQFADNGGKPIGDPLVLNPYAYGQFVIDDNASGVSLVFTCENATLTVPRSSFGMGSFIIRGTGQPEVKSMSATLNGKEIGIFPVPPVVPLGILPSDYLAGRESNKLIGPPSQFLAFKGLDTRAGSCQYYKSIGAVEDCDKSGNYTGKNPPLTFNAWRKQAQIDGSSFLEESAVFINKTDLNLTRDHHFFQIQNTAQMQNSAAYVCNHPGPAPDPKTDPTGLFPSPLAVNTAIDDVLQVDALHPHGRNVIACVAMDRMPITSVTGQPVTGAKGEQFVRFLIFGPNGDLLPSVNLDGNGEKFVPGACVACHGGAKYFRTIFDGFPETGTPDPDLGSYFLPYDVDNFEFHSQHPLTKLDQQSDLFVLNYYAWNVNEEIAITNNQPNQAKAFDNLFNGWYPNNSPVFNSTWVPNTVYKTSDSQSFYLNVVARSCRTCHIANDFDGSFANFELHDPVTLGLSDYVCGESLAAYTADPSKVDPEGSASSYLMPNSRVIFDRFWLSGRPSTVGQPPGTVDQPTILKNYYNGNLLPNEPPLSCHLP
jgi:hypothetical protein